MRATVPFLGKWRLRDHLCPRSARRAGLPQPETPTEAATLPDPIKGGRSPVAQTPGIQDHRTVPKAPFRTNSDAPTTSPANSPELNARLSLNITGAAVHLF